MKIDYKVIVNTSMKKKKDISSENELISFKTCIPSLQISLITFVHFSREFNMFLAVFWMFAFVVEGHLSIFAKVPKHYKCSLQITRFPAGHQDLNKRC